MRKRLLIGERKTQSSKLNPISFICTDETVLVSKIQNY